MGPLYMNCAVPSDLQQQQEQQEAEDENGGNFDDDGGEVVPPPVLSQPPPPRSFPSPLASNSLRASKSVSSYCTVQYLPMMKFVD